MESISEIHTVDSQDEERTEAPEAEATVIGDVVAEPEAAPVEDAPAELGEAPVDEPVAIVAPWVVHARLPNTIPKQW